jgi:hypothetical protein
MNDRHRHSRDRQRAGVRKRGRADGASSRPAVPASDAQARWDLFADRVRQTASAIDDTESFQAAFNAMAQAARSLYYQQLLNTVHVPDDAGEYADALRAMLMRVPNGWGRWICCDRGWYPLIVELDEQLRALLPDYIIHQVKEKFGGLRFDWGPGEDIDDPEDPRPSPPRSQASAAEQAQSQQAHDAWHERRGVYRQTPEGQERIAELERRGELARGLVAAAERRSFITCELCGAPGRMHRRASHAYYKTLCSVCAERLGYVTAANQSYAQE